jgi:hypothetical protein
MTGLRKVAGTLLCAWVLWNNLTVNVKGELTVKRLMLGAYETKTECNRSAKELDQFIRDTRPAPGEGELLFKDGSLLVNEHYACWPDTADPRGRR